MSAYAQLETLLSSSRVITDPDLLETYRTDQTAMTSAGHPAAVVLAGHVADVRAVLRWADEHRMPVVPRGAGTSLAGGATALDGCLVLVTTRMASIRELDTDNRLAVAEAGVVTADLDREARRHGLMYAPDPSSYETSTIGGNLATNAGGLRCLKYGVTRQSVLGLEVVLADGRLIHTGGRTAKHVTGYDLTGLFVGSEGTLGVITSATLRLHRAPVTPPTTIAATFPDLAAAGSAVTRILDSGRHPSLLELMDRRTVQAIDDWKHLGIGPAATAMLITQCDDEESPGTAKALAQACRDAGAADVEVSDDAATSEQLIALRRLAYPATERLGKCLVEDVCVPQTALVPMIERIEAIQARHAVTVATVAHAGDGNLHPVFIYDRCHTEPPGPVWAAADEIFRTALELGGTLTGEHGVGLVKQRWLDLELSSESRAVHRQIKAALDPHNILNTGKAI